MLTLRPAVVADAPVVPVTWVCGNAEAVPQMTAKGLNKTTVPGALSAAIVPGARSRREPVIEFDASRLDSASLRSAGKELLSLALIDARNHTLRWATALAAAGDGRALLLPDDLAPAPAAELDPPLWTLGHIAWFQEYWIGRNVQRARGESADAAALRLASILPDADRWYDPALVDRPQRRALADGELPDLQATRDFLVESLETTLELLASSAAEDDASLYFHRLALFHEELHAEGFAVLAQSLGIDDKVGLVPRLATQAARPALSFPATRWLLGASGPGFHFDNEFAPHPVDIPEFEIDAQVVEVGAVRRVRRGRRLRRARPLERRRLGLGSNVSRGARRATSTRCATASCSAASACWRASLRRSLPCT